MPVFVFLLLIALIAWVTVLWRPRSLPGVTRQRPWLVGHRGVRPLPRGEDDPPHRFEDVPENTIAAFEIALDEGLDGVECDVQMTRDGQLVLWHDRDMDGRVIVETPFAELRREEPSLATLDELLRLMGRYPGTVLNVEIKLHQRRGRGIERKVAREVSAAGLEDRVIVSSFDPLALARLRLVAPRLRIALLTAPQSPTWLARGWSAPWLHADALHPNSKQVDETLARRSRNRGLPMHAWTVNELDEVRRLLSLGAGGIIGDDPQILLEAAGRGKGPRRE